MQSTAIPEYLSLIVQTLASNQTFREARMSSVCPIFIYSLNSDNSEVVKTGYNTICEFFNKDLIVPRDILEQHLIGGYESEVLSYLLLDRISPTSSSMVSRLLQIAPDNKSAFSVLVADAAKPENVDAFKPQFQVLLFGELRIDQKLHLVMILLLHPSMRRHLANLKDFIDFIVGMIETGRVDLFDPSSCIIIKLLEYNSFINHCKTMQLMQKYIEVAVLQKKKNAIRLAIHTIDTAIRRGLVEECQGSINWIVSNVSVNGPNSDVALSALCGLTTSINTLNEMKKTELVMKVPQFFQHQKLKPYADVIHSAITR